VRPAIGWFAERTKRRALRSVPRRPNGGAPALGSRRTGRPAKKQGDALNAPSCAGPALAAACPGFAYWDLATPAGRSAYEEMAGIIPVGAALAGGILVLAAAAIWAWRRLQRR